MMWPTGSATAFWSATVPLAHLLPESDGPWSFRGEVGEPAMVARAAAVIAEVRGRPLDEVIAVLAGNVRRCVRLP